MSLAANRRSRTDRAPADADARRQALDPAASFIIQAPAGSGKTELLIRRYLTLLARVDVPEAVLALTFTRKAALEMRYRVLAALESASGPEPEGEHARETWRLAVRARAHDEERGWNLPGHPSRLGIQTIDALSASLVGRMPWTSRMGARVEPDEHVGYLYRRAALRTLGTTSGPGAEAADVVLRHLDNNVGEAARLLGGMLRRRDQWLRHVAGAMPASRLRSHLEGTLSGIVGRELGELERATPPGVMPTLIRAARFAAMRRAEAPEPGPIAACAALDAVPFGLRGWQGIAELLLTRSGSPRRTLDRRQGFPPTPRARILRDEVLGLDLDAAWLRRLAGVRELPPPAYGEGQWRVLEALLSLLPVAVARLRLEFSAEGVADFTEVAQAARVALGTPDAPTGLAFAMDCRLGHLLVDEFQDTSQSQYELLRMLTADWQAGDGRTLFLVGDPMQSIYGFRDADVGLFLGARRSGLGHLPLTPLTLTVNFRSRPEVVDWINAAVGPAFPPEEDILRGAVAHERSTAYAAAVSGDAGGAGVTVHPFSTADPEAEARRIVEIVHMARERSPDASIAVLVTARTHLGAALEALSSAGVPYEAVEIGSLLERPVVGDLLALVRGLLDPADRVSWLALLRAPWCGLVLEDLDALVGGDMTSAIWDLLTDRLSRPELAESPVSDDGMRRLARLYRVLEPALRLRAEAGFATWIEAVWMDLGGPATAREPAGLEDAETFFDLLGRMAPGDGIPNEERFLESLGALVGRSGMGGASSPPPVQLLTIHKAKGLEFDTVILPGTGRTGRDDERRLLSWLERLGPNGVPELVLAPIGETGGPEDPLFRYVRSVEKARREHEATRLLYVASTRARNHLHLLGHARLLPEGDMRPAGRSLLAKIWPAVQAEFRASAGEPGGATPPALPDEPRRGVPLRRLSLDWEAPDPPRFLPDPVAAASPAVLGEPETPRFDWAGDLQRRVGVVVHAILERLPGPEAVGLWLSDSGEARIRTALAAEGVGADEMDRAAGRVRRALVNTTEDPRGQWILRPREDDARELSVSHVTEQGVRRRVLDRTFVEDGVRWIIDYKTGAHEGAGADAFLDNELARYRSQLTAYGDAMRSVDSRPIRVGLYFPLLRGWRECSL